jgi:hypothetical protein
MPCGQAEGKLRARNAHEMPKKKTKKKKPFNTLFRARRVDKVFEEIENQKKLSELQNTRF